MDTIKKLDSFILNFTKKHDMLFVRLSIFIVYFWFGILKIIGTSPANPLVEDLLTKTLPFITFDQFIVIFAIFEMVIGIGFLIPSLGRVMLVFLAGHLVTTFMPLILLPSVAWQGFLTPTLEGQYIIKNVLIIALAFVVMARMNFLGGKKQK